MQNHKQDTIDVDGPEPFAKCQRCLKREADLTAAGEKVCKRMRVAR